MHVRLSAISRFLSLCFQKEVVRRALVVALIVGPILTLINQYDALVPRAFGWRFFLKLGLTFLVPYCVSTYSSVMAAGPTEKAVSDKNETAR